MTKGMSGADISSLLYVKVQHFQIERKKIGGGGVETKMFFHTSNNG